MWQTIPIERFEAFHDKFQGDSPEVFRICSACGGKCEYSKVSTLLPGEARYMASSLRMDETAFRERYVDGIRVDSVTLDVLKLVDPCPFLSPQFECGCRQCKVILCEIYPIVFEMSSNNTIEFSLDDWCPLAKTKRFREYFASTGIRALRALDMPLQWLQLVARYDELYFDYTKLAESRKAMGIAPSTFAVFDLEFLLNHQLREQDVIGRK